MLIQIQSSLLQILFLLVFITVVSLQTSFSQDNSSSYQTAIGVKLYPGTITLKKGVSGENYVEGQAAFFNKGFRLTALYEFHNNINSVEGLRWYYGGGPHLGFYNSKYYNGSTLLGVDGICWLLMCVDVCCCLLMFVAIC